jgi:hypothetical protein
VRRMSKKFDVNARFFCDPNMGHTLRLFDTFRQKRT